MQEKLQLHLRGFKMYSIAFLVFFCKLGHAEEKVEKYSKRHVQGGDVTLIADGNANLAGVTLM